MFFKYYSIYVKINVFVLRFRRLCLSKNYVISFVMLSSHYTMQFALQNVLQPLLI